MTTQELSLEEEVFACWLEQAVRKLELTGHADLFTSQDREWFYATWRSTRLSPSDAALRFVSHVVRH